MTNHDPGAIQSASASPLPSPCWGVASVGRGHDTPAFAVASIRQWWTMMGRRAYPQATALLITADAGGSNGYRSRAWKTELQRLADDLQLCLQVSHFPPGTSKWNKIEHRFLLSHYGKLARASAPNLCDARRADQPYDDDGWPPCQGQVGQAAIRDGLCGHPAEMRGLALHPHAFHGDWNYELRPRTKLTS